MSDSKPITRNEWNEQHLRCFHCGLRSPSGDGLETHEIARGAARQKALKEPATWLRLCNGFWNGCHELVSGWPLPKQLALKFLMDRGHYDRVKVNLLRGRQPEAITEEEVQVFVRELNQGR